MVMDLNTIEGSLSFAQLLTKFRDTYKKLKEHAIMVKKSTGKKKIEHLEEFFTYIRFAEAIIKRLNTLAILDTRAMAQSFNNHISASNITDQKQIDQIQAIYDRIIRQLEKVDRDNLIENRKAGDLIRLDRGVIGQVKSLRDYSIQAALRRKAANDNFQRQNRKAA